MNYIYFSNVLVDSYLKNVYSEDLFHFPISRFLGWFSFFAKSRSFNYNKIKWGKVYCIHWLAEQQGYTWGYTYPKLSPGLLFLPLPHRPLGPSIWTLEKSLIWEFAVGLWQHLTYLVRTPHICDPPICFQVALFGNFCTAWVLPTNWMLGVTYLSVWANTVHVSQQRGCLTVVKRVPDSGKRNLEGWYGACLVNATRGCGSVGRGAWNGLCVCRSRMWGEQWEQRMREVMCGCENVQGWCEAKTGLLVFPFGWQPN